MKLENKCILIISNEPWGKTWYSKHNYAWQLSFKNKVYFINPPYKFSLSNIFKKNIEEKTIAENLTVLTYRNILPVSIELLRKMNELYILRRLKKYLKQKKHLEFIIWTFDPIRLSNTYVMKPEKIILHIVDDYLFTYPSEKILAKKADVIFCVSDEIAQKYKQYNTNVHVIYHAIPDHEFIKPVKINNQRIKAIYVGNIDHRLDYDYNKYIIEHLPDVQFYFVGSIKPSAKENFEQLSKTYPNVSYMGEISYNELKNHISKSDICFVFKDIHHPGNNISSHKMLQYFAQGKPIFCTYLSRYKDIQDMLYMENDKQIMLEKITHYLSYGEEKDLIQKRINYAKNFTFTNILSQIENILNK
jgi:methionine synthase II (cobalamin-independent)